MIDYLDVLLWASLILSAVLLLVSTMSVGKHASDLLYQLEANLNGVRWIQSWINIRTQFNRVVFGLSYAIVLIMLLADVDVYLRTLVSRIMFFSLLIIFVASSIMDWLAEHSQMRILLKQAENNNVPLVRLLLHRLNNQLSILFGLVDVDCQPTQEILTAQAEIKDTIADLQKIVRSMDLADHTTTSPHKPTELSTETTTTVTTTKA